MSTQEGKRPEQQLQNLPFTEEQVIAIRECRTESFYYRCVPFTVIGLAGYHFLLGRGKIRAPTGWKKFTDQFVIISAAYMLGKLSYVNACREKLLKVESLEREDNSSRPIGRSIGTGVKQIKTLDENPASSSDIDTKANPFKGLDESFRPTVDTESDPYNMSQKRDSNDVKTDARIQNVQSRPSLSQNDEPRKRRVRRNIYGDVIEE